MWRHLKLTILIQTLVGLMIGVICIAVLSHVIMMHHRDDHDMRTQMKSMSETLSHILDQKKN